ncbi:MAG: hypothetical protein M1814_006664 [Vezdaea aestivalis]|nr:MAG: hypothetical protein M1814_006664 [Vezdaea aestivalis]
MTLETWNGGARSRRASNLQNTHLTAFGRAAKKRKSRQDRRPALSSVHDLKSRIRSNCSFPSPRYCEVRLYSLSDVHTNSKTSLLEGSQKVSPPEPRTFPSAPTTATTMAGELFNEISSTLSTWRQNASTNLSDGFSALTIQNYIRLAVIIGGYALLRRYLVMYGGKMQKRAHKQAEGEVIEDQDEAELIEDKEAETGWGGVARERQRRAMKVLLEREEKRLEMEEEDMKEIQQYLVD